MKTTEDKGMLREYVHNEKSELRLDREAGILRNVKILGLVSKNGRRYSAEALQAAVALYEGAKVNVNHPKGDPLSPRDYRDRIGNIQNVVFREGEGLFADLYFNPHHQLAEQLIWDATHAPRNVGFSHNIRAKTKQEGQWLEVTNILAVQSVDLVADPATTSGLFEAEESVPTPLRETLREELQETLCQDLREALRADFREEVTLLRGELERLQAQLTEFLRKNTRTETPVSRERETPFTAEGFSTQDFVRRICK